MKKWIALFLIIPALVWAICPTNVGVTSVGTGSSSGNSTFTNADAVTFASAGSVDTIQMYSSAGVSLIGYIYTDNAGQPGNLLGQSAGQTVAALGWQSLPLTASVNVSGGNTVYWVAFQINSDAAGPWRSIVAWAYVYKSSTVYGTPVANGATWTVSNAAQHSMYFTECVGGPQFPPGFL